METFNGILATAYEPMQALQLWTFLHSYSRDILDKLSFPNQDVLLCKFWIVVSFPLLSIEIVLMEKSTGYRTQDFVMLNAKGFSEIKN